MIEDTKEVQIIYGQDDEKEEENSQDGDDDDDRNLGENGKDSDDAPKDQDETENKE